MASLTLEIDTTDASAQLAALQVQAEQVLATVEKCKAACASCTVGGALTKQGADLVAFIREEDYRAQRTA